jgi:hypothetical protein
LEAGVAFNTEVVQGGGGAVHMNSVTVVGKYDVVFDRLGPGLILGVDAVIECAVSVIVDQATINL